MARHRNKTRKVFGIVSLVFGLSALGFCIWLVTVALKDYRCRDFDRSNILNRGSFYGGSYGYNTRNEYRRDSWQNFGYQARERGIDRDEGRTTEDYCINFVDNWTIGAGIGIGFCIVQLIVAIGYIIAATGDQPLKATGPKVWTWIFCVTHAVFAVGMGAGLFFAAIEGDVTRYRHNTRNVGYWFCAALGFNAIVSIVLCILGCVMVIRRIGDGGYEEGDERPNSRTQFIAQNQQLQQQHVQHRPAKEAHF